MGCMAKFPYGLDYEGSTSRGQFSGEIRVLVSVVLEGFCSFVLRCMPTNYIAIA